MRKVLSLILSAALWITAPGPFATQAFAQRVGEVEARTNPVNGQSRVSKVNLSLQTIGLYNNSAMSRIALQGSWNPTQNSNLQGRSVSNTQARGMAAQVATPMAFKAAANPAANASVRDPGTESMPFFGHGLPAFEAQQGQPRLARPGRKTGVLSGLRSFVGRLIPGAKPAAGASLVPQEQLRITWENAVLRTQDSESPVAGMSMGDIRQPGLSYPDLSRVKASDGEPSAPKITPSARPRSTFSFLKAAVAFVGLLITAFQSQAQTPSPDKLADPSLTQAGTHAPGLLASMNMSNQDWIAGLLFLSALTIAWFVSREPDPAKKKQLMARGIGLVLAAGVALAAFPAVAPALAGLGVAGWILFGPGALGALYALYRLQRFGLTKKTAMIGAVSLALGALPFLFPPLSALIGLGVAAAAVGALLSLYRAVMIFTGNSPHKTRRSLLWAGAAILIIAIVVAPFAWPYLASLSIPNLGTAGGILFGSGALGALYALYRLQRFGLTKKTAFIGVLSLVLGALPFLFPPLSALIGLGRAAAAVGALLSAYRAVRIFAGNSPHKTRRGLLWTGAAVLIIATVVAPFAWPSLANISIPSTEGISDVDSIAMPGAAGWLLGGVMAPLVLLKAILTWRAKRRAMAGTIGVLGLGLAGTAAHFAEGLSAFVSPVTMLLLAFLGLMAINRVRPLAAKSPATPATKTSMLKNPILGLLLSLLLATLWWVSPSVGLKQAAVSHSLGQTQIIKEGRYWTLTNTSIWGFRPLGWTGEKVTVYELDHQVKENRITVSLPKDVTVDGKKLSEVRFQIKVKLRPDPEQLVLIDQEANGEPVRIILNRAQARLEEALGKAMEKGQTLTQIELDLILLDVMRTLTGESTVQGTLAYVLRHDHIQFTELNVSPGYTLPP